MRFVATVFLWLVTTVALAVAVPTMWAQRTVVSEDGYAALAASAAKEPQLQNAMASELTTQIMALGADNGYHLNRDLVRGVTAAYTGNAPGAGRPARDRPRPPSARTIRAQRQASNSARAVRQ